MSYIKYVIDIFANYIFLTVYKKINRIKSSTAYSDLHALFLLARDGWGDGFILEVGAYHGKSTVCMALGSAAGKREKVVSIDPHTPETSKIFLDNIKAMGVAEQITPVFKTSEETRKNCSEPVRLVFIDGDHAYESMKRDIILWKDLVIDGGVMVFHDINWDSVNKAIDEIIMHSPEFIVEGKVGCSLMVSKGISRNSSVFREIAFFNKLKSLAKKILGKS